MFLMLGLLVTPTALVPDLAAGFGVALVLIFVARPIAVWLCLKPFRFSAREIAFISWVGLRGAVPIFLASIPVIAGVADGMRYFNVAFIVVLFSLVIQGWTVSRAAQVLGLELPPPPETPDRQEIELPQSVDRDAAGWNVAPASPALSQPFAALSLPKRTKIIAVIREGALVNRQTLERLQVDDYVIALAPPEQVIALDTLFSTPVRRQRRLMPVELGEFVFDAEVKLGQVCAMYGVPFEPLDHGRSLADFLNDRLEGNVVVGDRVKIGEVELVVRQMDKELITKVGLEIEPETERLPILRFWQRVKGLLQSAR